MHRRACRRKRNEGSAFVISILVLFVLTVLGLALMLTTTTEKEIAINYRWGEQAFFNADAALEYGKNVLASYALVNGSFQALLPPPRGPGEPFLTTVSNPDVVWGGAHPEGGAPCNPATAGCRDYQYYIDRCPAVGDCTRVYIGRVLLRPDTSPVMYDFRAPAGTPGDLDGDGARDLDGTFTLWVRRPLQGNADYGFPDPIETPAGLHDRVILTAEGTAPNAQGAGTGRATSLRRLEMSIRLPGSGTEGTEHSSAENRSDRGPAKGSYSDRNTVP